MDKQFYLTLYDGFDYLCILGSKLIHVSKSDPWWPYHEAFMERDAGTNVKAEVYVHAWKQQ